MKEGQTVYLRPTEMGNAYRRDKSIKEATIKKVGSKYVFLDGNYGKYDKETREEATNYSSDYIMYLDKQEAVDYIEHRDLSFKIRQKLMLLQTIPVDLEKIKKIAELLGL